MALVSPTLYQPPGLSQGSQGGDQLKQAGKARNTSGKWLKLLFHVISMGFS